MAIVTSSGDIGTLDSDRQRDYGSLNAITRRRGEASAKRGQASGRTRPRRFSRRDLSGSDYVYVWVDGIHLKVRVLVSPAGQCPCRATESAHPAALAALKDIYIAEDIDKAQVAVIAFEVDYGAKYPKAVAKITGDLEIRTSGQFS